MQHASQDTIRELPLPPGRPDYNHGNPVNAVVRAMEAVQFAAGWEHYVVDSREFLFPFDKLELHGPPEVAADDLANPQHDVKEAFDKQNIASISFGRSFFARGYVRAGSWGGPFLRVGYEAGLGSPLRSADGGLPGEAIKLRLKVNGVGAPTLLRVPYNWATHRYELEIWSYPGPDLAGLLDGRRGKPAIQSGELIALPSVVQGDVSDFSGPAFDASREAATRNGFGALSVFERSPNHLMHPIRPCRLEVAWTNESETLWDDNGGAGHRYEFGMAFRGWRHYRAVGVSSNPHGGLGHLEFRNLFSNYFQHEAARQAELGQDTLTELGRDLPPWSYDADWKDLDPGRRRVPRDGRKVRPERESFMAVDYMDLHRLNAKCCIGIHRHRDNQEAFLLLRGKALMLVGDWCQMPGRQRAMEVRTMLEGDVSVCKTGQLHALFNHLDEPIELFMFGGYD